LKTGIIADPDSQTNDLEYYDDDQSPPPIRLAPEDAAWIPLEEADEADIPW
jgi:hypothetical protein